MDWGVWQSLTQLSNWAHIHTSTTQSWLLLPCIRFKIENWDFSKFIFIFKIRNALPLLGSSLISSMVFCSFQCTSFPLHWFIHFYIIVTYSKLYYYKIDTYHSIIKQNYIINFIFRLFIPRVWKYNWFLYVDLMYCNLVS